MVKNNGRIKSFGVIGLLLLSFVSHGAFWDVSGTVEGAFYLAASEVWRASTVSGQWSADIAAEIGLIGRVGNGSGVRVALIDTGVDVRVVPRENVSAWIDLTTEGTVPMSAPLQVSPSGTVAYGGRLYNAAGIETKSGSVRIGIFRPGDEISENAPCRDFLDPIREIPVLIADSHLPKQYDTVYVDTDLDGSFGDETGLKVYRDSRASVSVRELTGRPGSFTLVVSEILDNGSRVLLGFDGNGHGTSVASILTGYPQVMNGVAPGVTLLVIKAVESSGRTSWNLLARAIDVACELGARVIVLAVAPSDSKSDTSAISAVMERAGRDYGTVIVLPAGNQGPGLGTLPAYADLENVVTAGGYIPKSTSRYLNWNAGGLLWPWSSMGPTANGSTVTVLAPAVAPALVPFWVSAPDQPRLFEGTSCSAAYVGGVAALLLEHQTKAGKATSALLIKKALIEGAEPLPGTDPVEQGSGLLNAMKSLEALAYARENVRVRSVSKWGSNFLVNGFFVRDKIPGYVPVSIDNLSPFSMRVQFEVPEWLDLRTKDLGIPAVEQRTVFGATRLGLSPGLHSAWVKADDPSIPGRELQMLWTILVPRDLTGVGRIGTQRLLLPGEIYREYIRIPEGLEYLGVSCEVIQGLGGNPRGRVKVYVYGDKSQLVYESDWIGTGAERRSADVKMKFPSAGVWEVVVITDPALPLRGARESAVKLDIYSAGLVTQKLSNALRISDNGPIATGTVTVLNLGPDFTYDPLIVISGETGTIASEDLTLSNSAALMKPLPIISERTKRVYIAASDPTDPTASLSVFLYYFDKESSRWVQIASSKGDERRGAEISLLNPKPGQYIAYVEGSHLTASETHFRWLAVVAEDEQAFSVTDSSPGKENLTWHEDTAKILTFNVPASLAQVGESKRIFLTIWDNESGQLRNIIPIYAYSGSPSPFVYVCKGATFDGRLAVTIRAWDPRTFKPIDALVRLDDVWYQLYKGEATVMLNKTSLDGTVLLAEYPGMSPSMKVLADMP